MKAINPFIKKVIGFVGLFVMVFACASIQPSYAKELKVKRTETGLYRDIVDDNVYYDLTSYLRFDRFFRKITGKKKRSLNVNVYDEVPDSSFFTNRHFRNSLSASDLEKGASVNSGPDLSAPLQVIKGKTEGLNPGFFVKDAKGDKYLLKFDYIDSFELRTSAEVIASRVYHALGYNVPQYTIVSFSQDQLIPSDGAMMIDENGFNKPLTAERLEEYMLFLPQDAEGRFRASASKIIEGDVVGYLSFNGRRKGDPEDLIDHRDRREIRALRVFSSWVNNYDTRDGNSLDVIVSENGQQRVKHYLIDFGSSLGGGSAVPMFAREHMMDYGEATKAFFSLGLWEKPWQKRWREGGDQFDQSPAVGDFDNRYFYPDKFKTQLPYYAFKDLTRADAFWAAKVIMSFSDDDIAAMVKAGQYSSSDDAATITKILSERRDLIGKHWFEASSPLDNFKVDVNSLTFEDLSVKYGFVDSAQSSYQVEIVGKNNGKKSRKESLTLNDPSLDLASWMKDHESLCIDIRVVREGDSESHPKVNVRVDSGKIIRIQHAD